MTTLKKLCLNQRSQTQTEPKFLRSSLRAQRENHLSLLWADQMLANRHYSTDSLDIQNLSSLLLREPHATECMEHASGRVGNTGGLLGTTHEWSEDIHNQALGAISEADIIIYLLDWTDKIHPNDVKISRLLRKQTFLRDVRSLLSSDKQIIKEGDEQQKKIKPVIVAMNKCDNEQRIESLNELSLERLGLGPALAISAIHGIGVMELLDTLTKKFAELGFEQISDDDEEEAKDIKIAIVGKPNVGKSSLLNTILGFERSIVSPVPGSFIHQCQL
jgi:predicted GTPase